MLLFISCQLRFISPLHYRISIPKLRKMGLFLPFVYNLLFTALLFSRPSVQIRLRNETQSCPNPVTPITIANFEYTEGLSWSNGGLFNSYHGLTWRGWSGFKRYPGYSTGYSPIPSNYTTLVGGSAGNDTKVLEFGEFLLIGGPIQGVHSVSSSSLHRSIS